MKLQLSSSNDFLFNKSNIPVRYNNLPPVYISIPVIAFRVSYVEHNNPENIIETTIVKLKKIGYGYLLDCLSMYRQEIMSEQSKDDIRRSCDEAMNQMDKKVVDIINANKELFDTIVTTLMKKQFLSKDEIIRMEKRISK